MDEQERLHAFRELTNILSENGLNWVNEQVDRQIRLGKTVRREIETLKEDRNAGQFSFSNDYSSTLTKGPKVTFPVTEEYDAGERLTLLINAIRRVVVDTAETEQQLMNSLQADEGGPATIEFQDEAPESKPRYITSGSTDATLAGAQRLRLLLDALEREIGT